MQASRQKLIEIVCKASTITERLGTEFLCNEVLENDALVNFRIEKWCKNVAQGNLKQLEKRLAWDGLDLNTVRRVLGSVSIADNQLLPAWVNTLENALKTATLVSLETSEESDSNEKRFLDPQEPIPFEEIFLPFIEVARRKLIAQAGSSYQLLSESAHAALERSLLSRLSGLGSQALELKFSIFRTFKQPTLTRVLNSFQGSLAKEQYRAFIRNMLDGQLLSFFQEYSVLARLLAVATDLWVETTGEFLQRLTSDYSEIQQTFQNETELGQVVAVKPFISDPHNQGRTASAVTFSSGLRLIYKPKDLGIEDGYFKLLTWFNDHGTPLPFKLLKVLNRSTHGWVEFVEHLTCKNQEEAKRYYQRAGMLLGMVYALHGTDCHAENIIACGEHPVLVDMETLMHPQVREVNNLGVEAGAQLLAIQQLEDSVLKTGFLPQWEFGQDWQVVYDVSGLGGVAEQDVPFRVQTWKNINTDGMVLGYEQGKLPPVTNVPSLDGVNLSPNDYVEELVDGFRQMYQFLLEHRDALLAPDGPLVALAHQRVRFIFRNTNVYCYVLQKTLHPKFLRDGVDRSIALDVLSKALLAPQSKPSLWPLLREEQQALNQLDIPYFTARSDSEALNIAPNQTIEQCFTEPGYKLIITRLRQLNDGDLEQQIGFIRGALYSRIVGQTLSTSLRENVALDLDALAPLSQGELVQQAVAIAVQMQQRVIHSPDNSAAWITLEYISQAQRFQLQPIGYRLSDGSCGLALFLAALEKVTGGAGFRNLTLAALQHLRQSVQKPEFNRIIKTIGIGGATGLGSIIYALVRISQFLDESGLVEDAKQVAALITPDLVAAAREFDIGWGAAGTILGLLALYQITFEPAVLAQAIACGHHLLNNRVASNCGYRAWATVNGKLLTGFSHGAAGIAYALLRLYTITQDVVFLEAAEEAIAYERSVFSPEAGNWPDFRSEQPGFMTSWCHGAPGIALARLGSLAILDTREIRQDIEAALQTTLAFGLHDIDHLCCGNFGRLEVCLVASRQLARQELLETAQKQASWVVSRAGKTGAFYLLPNLPTDVYIPGFFQGTAGIGYELLRLAYPDLLPSVLLWQ
jgi:type 2 lantibiotic biosynthesis protein LanM